MQKVEKLDFGFRPESVTDPFLVSDANSLVFCFLAVARKDNGFWNDCGLAIVKTKSSLLYRYGYPNDEAALCSPLAESGYDGFSISKVNNSKWIKEIENQNSRKWPDSNYSKHFSHWVFLFKETTLEIIASDLEWALTEKSYNEVQAEMLSWINENEC